MTEPTVLQVDEESPRGQINAIIEQNDARLHMLALRGEAPNPLVLFQQKLDHVIDFAIGGAMRDAFDFILAKNVSAFLDEWEQMQRMNSLTAGVPPLEGA